MTPASIVLSPEDISVRRAELMERSGMTLEELRDKNDSFELDQNGQAILRRLEELEFLEGR